MVSRHARYGYRAMRMRQSIAEIEDAFFEEIEDDRERREKLRKRAERRAAERQAKRTHRHGSMRFVLLILVLIATAAIVTYAMFMTLYYVLSPS
jgi:membrane glycosyltransferase